MAWSYSALTAFEICPKKFAAERVYKTVVEPQGEQLLYGQRVHKSLEMRVKRGAALPDDVKHMEPTLAKLLTLGQPLSEQRYALDRSYRVTEYFDSASTMPDRRVWLRIVIDLQILMGKRALLLDYKTGKEKHDLDQLELFAATSFAMHPELEEVRTGYWWTTDNKITPQPYTPKEAPVIWQKFLPRVAVLENAYKTNAWQAKPNGLCRNHCLVLDCAFNGRGKNA
jgi:hypothetical protein